MLNLITLSGYEGVGKSTIINHFQQYKNFNVIPETARLIMPLDKGALKESRDDLSYKSFISYITNVHFLLSNKISMNVVSDRNIIDSLTYLELYSDQRIDLNETGDFIEKLLEEHHRDYLYDEMFLIRHPQDDKYILENILSDPDRIYGRDVKQYKDDSARWEGIYTGIAEVLVKRGLAPKLNTISAYPENPNIIQEIELEIAKDLFK